MFPPLLKSGDTIGLISPAGSLYEHAPYQQAVQLLQSLNFQVKCGRYWQAKNGYLAGTDQQRVSDLHAMFADPEVKAIIAFRGGWGSARLLPYIDFDLIAANPKIFMGYSDITALLLAIYSQTGLITWHGAVARDLGNAFTLNHLQHLLCEKAGEYFGTHTVLHTYNMVQTGNKLLILKSGTATGKLLGGNLSVLCSLIGSKYLPQWDGAILFLEDVGEATYRIDRLFCQLKLSGILDKIAGIVLGAFTNCPEGTGEYSRSIEAIFNDYIVPLGIPAFAGAQFGHIPQKVLLPVGATVHLDAEQANLHLVATS
ncbi:MAG: LD-carboxypeptidase [Cytophagales bacterium]|nr:LD-carboxypeptidase [Bernardetiaceae bacterium]MDW8204995.1 LD-carboxypeptidase [Cytophagales bacterium]